MKISISNIAWNHNEDLEIILLLKKYAIAGVEIAPTKIWKSPINESSSSIKSYRKYWENEGIVVSSTQSLLFGHPELSIFENKESRLATLAYLKKIIRVSALLGAESMVFGSPKNRNIKNIKMKEALETALEFFYKIGEISQSYNIFFCIEPNPKEYGTNFINTTEEAVKLIELVNHPYFKLHLDSGVLTVNKEDYLSAITEGFPILKHFHISEKDLLPIGNFSTDHRKIATILNNLHYKRWVAIEMRGSEGGHNKKNVESALKLAVTTYVSS